MILPGLLGGLPATSGDGFQSSVTRIDARTAAAMTGASWKQGCPVPIADLRRVKLTFWGFDRHRHRGELIVNQEITGAVVTAFHTLYKARFPIRRMRPVDFYGADDNKSMADDNTSAFNCRPITGSATGFSVHSYGKAIDIDTVENPYVKGSIVQPPAGAAYLDRAGRRPGVIAHGDPVWRAFTGRGFQWGGDWNSLKDYQHFEFPI